MVTMWKKFKWDMFVTSFIPLWISIIIFDIWDIVAASIKNWSKNEKLFHNLKICVQACAVQLISILIIVIMVLISIRGINNFLRERNESTQNPQGLIIKARKANKLSSEFLLAYILPLIAFDFGCIKSIFLFLVYFSILAFLCIRNNNIYTNIMLEFKKYRLFSCDIQCELPGEKKKIYYDSLVISRDDLSIYENKEVKYWDCDNYIYIHIGGGAQYE